MLSEDHLLTDGAEPQEHRLQLTMEYSLQVHKQGTSGLEFLCKRNQLKILQRSSLKQYREGPVGTLRLLRSFFQLRTKDLYDLLQHRFRQEGMQIPDHQV